VNDYVLSSLHLSTLQKFALESSDRSSDDSIAFCPQNLTLSILTKPIFIGAFQALMYIDTAPTSAKPSFSYIE
jgi:hypothetical protein